MATISLSNNSDINALLLGSYWAGNTLSYSIPSGTDTYWPPNYLTDEPDTWAALNSTQANYFRNAIEMIDEVIPLNLIEVVDNQNTQGDIRVAFTSDTSLPNASAWAYGPPAASNYAEAGDLWIKPTVVDFNPDTFYGASGFATVIHELGHALGLKHPFAPSGSNTTILTGVEDTTQYTVMSYTDYDGAGKLFTTPDSQGSYFLRDVQPETLMLYDILTLQYIYGVDQTTRTGDDNYTFSNSKGELKTIWDAGGTDTFDLSNQSRDMTINLNDGEFSSLGVRQIELNGSLSTAINNVAIAFGATIENAIGGSGDDSIIGNEVNNLLEGGRGDDTIDGGAGIDTAIYALSRDDYEISTNNNQTTVTALSGNEGRDSLQDIEYLQFADETISLGADTPLAPTTSAEVDVTPTEGDDDHVNYFLLELTEASSSDFTVEYTTRNGSATAGEDYLATSGTATIKAGDTYTAIPVTILGDNIVEGDETFSLVLSNPTGIQFNAGVEEITATHTIMDDDQAAQQPLLADLAATEQAGAGNNEHDWL